MISMLELDFYTFFHELNYSCNPPHVAALLLHKVGVSIPAC